MKTLRLGAAVLALMLLIPTFFGVSYRDMLMEAISGRWAGGSAPAPADTPAPDPAGSAADAPAPDAAAPPGQAAAPAAPEPAAPPGPPRDAALLDGEALGEERTATVILPLPFEAFLAPREAVPDPAYRDLFAETRAAALAKDECRLLLSTFAKACLPLAADAEPAAEGGYRVTLKLAFAPAEPIRELAESEAFEREAARRPIALLDAEPVAAGALGAARETLYRMAGTACYDPRGTGAACTLAEVAVEVSPAPESPGEFGVSGWVRLATSRPDQGG